MCTLSELANFRNGKFISSSNYSESGKFPVYGSNGKIANSNKCLNKNPVIVIGRVGAYCGSLHKINRPSWTTDNSIVVEPKDNIDFNFLYYKLKTLNLQNRDTGSAQGLLTQNSLKTISTKIPAFREQKRIGQILEILDKKITILEKHNSILEKIIDTIFKSWFIDFVDTEEFVDSELGQIPKGWKVSTIGNELKIHTGGTPSRKKVEYWKNGSVAWIGSKKINELRIIQADEFISEKGRQNSSTIQIPARTTVIAIIGNTIGKVSLTEINCCINQNIAAILSNEKLSSEFIYPWIKHMINEIVSWKSGGAQASLNQNAVKQTPLLIPDSISMKKYSELVKPLFDQICSNYFEINGIIQLRDLLLPKLLSGEIVV